MCRNRVDWVAAWTHIQCRNTGASNDISSESGSELSQVWLSAWAIQSLGFFCTFHRIIALQTKQKNGILQFSTNHWIGNKRKILADVCRLIESNLSEVSLSLVSESLINTNTLAAILLIAVLEYRQEIAVTHPFPSKCWINSILYTLFKWHIAYIRHAWSLFALFLVCVCVINFSSLFSLCLAAVMVECDSNLAPIFIVSNPFSLVAKWVRPVSQDMNKVIEKPKQTNSAGVCVCVCVCVFKGVNLDRMKFGDRFQFQWDQRKVTILIDLGRDLNKILTVARSMNYTLDALNVECHR